MTNLIDAALNALNARYTSEEARASQHVQNAYEALEHARTMSEAEAAEIVDMVYTIIPSKPLYSGYMTSEDFYNHVMESPETLAQWEKEFSEA